VKLAGTFHCCSTGLLQLSTLMLLPGTPAFRAVMQ